MILFAFWTTDAIGYFKPFLLLQVTDSAEASDKERNNSEGEAGALNAMNTGQLERGQAEGIHYSDDGGLMMIMMMMMLLLLMVFVVMLMVVMMAFDVGSGDDNDAN